MVAARNRGQQSLRSIAVEFGVALSTLQHWIAQAEGRRLDRVDFSDRRGGRRAGQATDARIEERVLELRQDLKDHSDLGSSGRPPSTGS